ncbi:hypothetical protein E3N88_15969 [Mikania micrantha]|uniref:Helitron helicase-like domain-containing protein n=1 Tax=Mikania micrantha TaxID=192012 RepID=A0A5N6NX51_9ASTR|nr:hypothetical protein E3N88_15969 [Mikania micrantha]
MDVTLDEAMDNMRDDVYMFHAHTDIFLKIDQLVPRDVKPKYLQLYFYDPNAELDHKLQWPNFDGSITEMLARVLYTNRCVKTFQCLGKLGPLENYLVTFNASVELDKRGESGWHPNIPCEEVSINEVHNNEENIDEEMESTNNCHILLSEWIVLSTSFIGGPRDMCLQYLDAMPLVQVDGKPDLFLTKTC